MTAHADGVVERYFWSRHANPRSVWTLVVAYPTLILAIYRRHRPVLLGTLAFVAVNPLVFRPPDDNDAWATRVVLGEKVWLERGPLSSPTDLLVAGRMAPVFLFTVRAALNRRPLRTVFGTVLSLVCMLLFFARMVQLYEGRRAD